MSETPGENAPQPPPPPAEPAPEIPRRRVPAQAIAAAAASVLVVIAVIVAAPLWAPSVMRALPWGSSEKAQEPAKPAPQAVAPTPDPAVATLKAQLVQNAATLQQLTQRIAALEARPTPQPSDLGPIEQRIAALERRPTSQPPDLGPIEQQLGALDKITADLKQSVAALEKTAQAQPATDPRNTALALVLLQIREAVDLGRPFGAEYQALVTLAGDRRELAAAAAPLAGPAESGVASRVVLVGRLRQLAPQIATADAPSSRGWTAQMVARLRGLVTIRRVGGSGQSPAEAAVSDAQHDLAVGDLARAVAALDHLDGAHGAAAEPWLNMAKDRLAVEAALRQVQTALAASLGVAVPAGKS
jgi:hypothetical protein